MAATQARAIQRTARQSPYKMRLVIDQIRGMGVNEALALLGLLLGVGAALGPAQVDPAVGHLLEGAELAAQLEELGSGLPVDVGHELHQQDAVVEVVRPGHANARSGQ